MGGLAALAQQLARLQDAAATQDCTALGIATDVEGGSRVIGAAVGLLALHSVRVVEGNALRAWQQHKADALCGNLPYSIDNAKLTEMFSAIKGIEVTEADVITDKFSGRSKGFGFVTLKTDEMAQTAISEMNGHELEGRALTVNIARPREERPAGGRNFDNRNSR